MTGLHGLGMADIDCLARVAVARARARQEDYLDRYDAAWHAIAELLCTSAETPQAADLKNAGAEAVNRLAAAEGHHRGRDRRNWGAGLESMSAFQRYWALARWPARAPEEGVTERVALAQIWAVLSPWHREVLTAMAVHEDHQAAAAATGRSYACFTSHLRNARREFFALWHEGEQPSRVWGRSDRRHGSRTAAQLLVNRRQQQARRLNAAKEDRPMITTPKTQARDYAEAVVQVLRALTPFLAADSDAGMVTRLLREHLRDPRPTFGVIVDDVHAANWLLYEDAGDSRRVCLASYRLDRRPADDEMERKVNEALRALHVEEC